MQKAGELGREAVLPPDQVAPAQGNARRAPKVSVKPFQRLAESRDRVSGRSRRSETPQDGCGNPRACARSAVPSGRQAAVLNSGVWVRLGAIAVFRPAGQEAQTAAGVRGRAFLPKTARRAPQALEAGAFWDHQPKSLSLRSLAVLLRTVSSVFVWVWFGGLSWAVRN